jgi:acyl-coenzyme A thioesterase PaaI-like protein
VQTLLKIAFRRHWRLLNLWPPFLGAGIRVTRIGPGWREVDVEMKLRGWNRNYVGTHYGGSLYSLADPWFMLMLIENLGPDYIVWDKSASIRFRRPGTGLVRAEFRLSEEQIQDIQTALETEEKVDRTFSVDVKDESGAVIAEVQKVIHVKRKAATIVASKRGATESVAIR